MGWDGEENYMKAYKEVFIQIKRKERDMITWKQYKMALKATLHFRGGCLDVSFEEGEEDEECEEGEESAKGEESEEGDDDEEKEVMEKPIRSHSKRKRSLRSS
jgi:hypothetical protein